jgi:hypothetical protein
MGEFLQILIQYFFHIIISDTNVVIASEQKISESPYPSPNIYKHSLVAISHINYKIDI